jgi:hypothetical protein
VKALFTQCGGFVTPPLNNMEVPANILNGQIEDVAMGMPNSLMQGVCASTSQVEGA